MKKYWTVALLGWQDSLVYRLNALVWALYAVLPSLTIMLVWIAAYGSDPHVRIGGLTLSQMMTYYLCVTALSVVVTPNPEWEIAQMIRDGHITQFIVRPIGFYGYRMSQETAYQVVKTTVTLPGYCLIVWVFRAYIAMPSLDIARSGLFGLSCLLAYGLLTQIKFLLGISAFWLTEPGGFFEIWNLLLALFAGRLLPLGLLPEWLRRVGEVLPFSVIYAFPMQLLLGTPTAGEVTLGFVQQIVWLALLSLLVRYAWQRGMLAYEAYGG